MYDHDDSSVAMPLTASFDGDGSSPPLPSPSPGDGDYNDPSHTLPSFTFVIYQLSVLLSSLGLTATDTFPRQQLLAALSNVLCTSIYLRQLPPSSIPAVHAARPPRTDNRLSERVVDRMCRCASEGREQIGYQQRSDGLAYRRN